MLISALAAAQTPRPAPKKVVAQRANELTLAGLRPGQNKVASAVAKYKSPLDGKSGESSYTWVDFCYGQLLAIDFDSDKKIQVVRVTAEPSMRKDCVPVPPRPWKTGNGLRLSDPVEKVVQLYGEPDSRSPSTKDGQPLELWYYAFDWAGAEVPQVMEVLCTKEKDGAPGRVVEIILAAPSL